MPSTLAPLNAERHRSLRFQPSQPYHFARTQMLCPVAFGEIRQVARDYVIVFPKAEGAPQALLGIEAGVNAYVDEDGRWLCRYVPAHIRRYPFFAAEAARDEAAGTTSFIVLIDEAAPHLGTAQGEPLFTQEGKPAPILEKVKQGLGSLQHDVRTVMRMVAELDRCGLLVERAIRVRPRGGAETGLTGFRVVDAKKLSAIAPDDLAKLHQSGALLLAYAHLVSLANLEDGVLTRGLKKPRPEGPDFDLGGTEGGSFRFN